MHCMYVNQVRSKVCFIKNNSYCLTSLNKALNAHTVRFAEWLVNCNIYMKTLWSRKFDNNTVNILLLLLYLNLEGKRFNCLCPVWSNFLKSPILHWPTPLLIESFPSVQKDPQMACVVPQAHAPPLGLTLGSLYWDNKSNLLPYLGYNP